MAANGRIRVGIAVALAAVGAWFAFGPAGDPVAPPSGPGGRSSASVAVPTVGTVLDRSVAATDGERTGVPSDRSRDRTGDDEARLATLRGRCVDGAGRPFADCRVLLSGIPTADDLWEWLRDHDEPVWQDPGAITTGEDGRFVFRFAPPPPYGFSLEIAHDGCATRFTYWRRLDAGAETDVGDTLMSAGVLVGGRVLDPDGGPVAGETVRLFHQGSRPLGDGQFAAQWGGETTSRADGAFAFPTPLAATVYQVSTTTPLVTPKSITLQVEPLSADLTIVVRQTAANARITGRVVDEAGAAVAGVQVEARTYGRKVRAMSAVDGSFSLARSDEDVATQATLLVASEAHEASRPEALVVAWGARGVELAVRRADELVLRVVDERGAALETYTVRLLPQDVDPTPPSAERVRAAGHHDDGTVVLGGLVRGTWLVWVEFPRTSGLAAAMAPLAHENPGRDRIDLVARPLARRPLRVVTADGTPIVGSTVRVCEPFARPFDAARATSTRADWFGSGNCKVALELFTGTTDGDGRIELSGPGGHELGLDLLGPGHVPRRIADLRLDVVGELVVQVDVGARVSVQIVPSEALDELRRLAHVAEGQPFPEERTPRLVLASETGQRAATMALSEDQAQLRFDARGVLLASGLPSGRWRVDVEVAFASSTGNGINVETLPGTLVELREGCTTQVDLDLTRILPGTVDGQVLRNGKPLANGAAALASEDRYFDLQTDAEGRFSCTAMPGTYDLLVPVRNRDDLTFLRCTTPVVVARGEVARRTFAVESGKLRITARNAAGEPVAGLGLQVVEGPADMPNVLPVPCTDALGQCEFELAAGPITLRVLPKPAESSGAAPIVVATLVLIGGETKAVEVRVPAEAGY